MIVKVQHEKRKQYQAYWHVTLSNLTATTKISLTARALGGPRFFSGAGAAFVAGAFFFAAAVLVAAFLTATFAAALAAGA